MGSEGWLVVGGNLGGTISSLASSPTSNSWSVQGSFCGEKTLSTFRRGWSRTKDAGTQRGSVSIHWEGRHTAKTVGRVGRAGRWEGKLPMERGPGTRGGPRIEKGWLSWSGDYQRP